MTVCQMVFAARKQFQPLLMQILCMLPIAGGMQSKYVRARWRMKNIYS